MLESESSIRLGVFLGVFALMVSWELLAPRRPALLPRRLRWPGNLGIQVVNALVLRGLFPGAAVGLAVALEGVDFGLLQWMNGPQAVEFVLALVLLDLAIYVQHRVMHSVPVFWRLHRMHHSDLHLDATSGLRFHPLEILLSMIWKGLVLLLLGAPVLAVLVFEILLNAMAVFNHANVRIPVWLDRILRLLLVTPDMHRVHHSVVRRETDSNFGFNLSLWDRLFRTYVPEPGQGQLGMQLGLPMFREPGASRLDRLLLQPFRLADAAAPVGKSDRGDEPCQPGPGASR